MDDSAERKREGGGKKENIPLTITKKKKKYNHKE